MGKQPRKPAREQEIPRTAEIPRLFEGKLLRGTERLPEAITTLRNNLDALEKALNNPTAQDLLETTGTQRQSLYQTVLTKQSLTMTADSLVPGRCCPGVRLEAQVLLVFIQHALPTTNKHALNIQKAQELAKSDQTWLQGNTMSAAEIDIFIERSVQIGVVMIMRILACEQAATNYSRPFNAWSYQDIKATRRASLEQQMRNEYQINASTNPDFDIEKHLGQQQQVALDRVELLHMAFRSRDGDYLRLSITEEQVLFMLAVGARHEQVDAAFNSSRAFDGLSAGQASFSDRFFLLWDGLAERIAHQDFFPLVYASALIDAGHRRLSFAFMQLQLDSSSEDMSPYDQLLLYLFMPLTESRLDDYSTGEQLAQAQLNHQLLFFMGIPTALPHEWDEVACALLSPRDQAAETRAQFRAKYLAVYNPYAQLDNLFEALTSPEQALELTPDLIALTPRLDTLCSLLDLPPLPKWDQIVTALQGTNQAEMWQQLEQLKRAYYAYPNLQIPGLLAQREYRQRFIDFFVQTIEAGYFSQDPVAALKPATRFALAAPQEGRAFLQAERVVDSMLERRKKNLQYMQRNHAFFLQYGIFFRGTVLYFLISALELQHALDLQNLAQTFLEPYRAVWALAVQNISDQEKTALWEGFLDYVVTFYSGQKTTPTGENFRRFFQDFFPGLPVSMREFEAEIKRRFPSLLSQAPVEPVPIPTTHDKGDSEPNDDDLSTKNIFCRRPSGDSPIQAKWDAARDAFNRGPNWFIQLTDALQPPVSVEEATTFLALMRSALHPYFIAPIDPQDRDEELEHALAMIGERTLHPNPLVQRTHMIQWSHQLDVPLVTLQHSCQTLLDKSSPEARFFLPLHFFALSIPLDPNNSSASYFAGTPLLDHPQGEKVVGSVIDFVSPRPPTGPILRRTRLPDTYPLAQETLLCQSIHAEGAVVRDSDRTMMAQLSAPSFENVQVLRVLDAHSEHLTQAIENLAAEERRTIFLQEQKRIQDFLEQTASRIQHDSLSSLELSSSPPQVVPNYETWIKERTGGTILGQALLHERFTALLVLSDLAAVQEIPPQVFWQAVQASDETSGLSLRELQLQVINRAQNQGQNLNPTMFDIRREIHFFLEKTTEAHTTMVAEIMLPFRELPELPTAFPRLSIPIPTAPEFSKVRQIRTILIEQSEEQTAITNQYNTSRTTCLVARHDLPLYRDLNTLLSPNNFLSAIGHQTYHHALQQALDAYEQYVVLDPETVSPDDPRLPDLETRFSSVVAIPYSLTRPTSAIAEKLSGLRQLNDRTGFSQGFNTWLEAYAREQDIPIPELEDRILLAYDIALIDQAVPNQSLIHEFGALDPVGKTILEQISEQLTIPRGVYAPFGTSTELLFALQAIVEDRHLTLTSAEDILEHALALPPTIPGATDLVRRSVALVQAERAFLQDPEWETSLNWMARRVQIHRLAQRIETVWDPMNQATDNIEDDFENKLHGAAHQETLLQPVLEQCAALLAKIQIPATTTPRTTPEQPENLPRVHELVNEWLDLDHLDYNQARALWYRLETLNIALEALSGRTRKNRESIRNLLQRVGLNGQHRNVAFYVDANNITPDFQNFIRIARTALEQRSGFNPLMDEEVRAANFDGLQTTTQQLGRNQDPAWTTFAEQYETNVTLAQTLYDHMVRIRFGNLVGQED